MFKTKFSGHNTIWGGTNAPTWLRTCRTESINCSDAFKFSEQFATSDGKLTHNLI